jgi:hypothetical protein
VQFTAQSRSQSLFDPVRKSLMGDPALDEAVAQLGQRLLPLGIGRPDALHAVLGHLVGCHTWIIGLGRPGHKVAAADAMPGSLRAARGRAAASGALVVPGN